MRQLVLTGWSGTAFAKIAAHTLPLLERYAQRHGVTFACSNLFGARPPSWNKILMLQTALEQFDLVVWIDADVVVLEGDRWIGDELQPGTIHGLVAHDTECGEVPNCGVWICTREMLPVLGELWGMEEFVRHPWWEQGALLTLLGYHVTEQPSAKRERPSDLYVRTTWLAPEWNHHPRDARKVDTPRFVHVTQYAERLATVKELCSHANP